MEESKEEQKERGLKMEEEKIARDEAAKEERETYITTTNTSSSNYRYIDYLLQSWYVLFDEVVRVILRFLGFEEETTSEDSTTYYCPQDPATLTPEHGRGGGGGGSGGDSTSAAPEPTESEDYYQGRIRGRKPPKPGIGTGKDPGIH